MNEEYLWNREGETDPEIARLEQLLEPLRYELRTESFERHVELKAIPRQRIPAWRWGIGIAAMALLALAIGFGLRARLQTGSPASTWQLFWNDSTPHAVKTGQTIDTGDHSVARLESDFVGEVRVDPSSRLHIVQATQNQQRLALERGTIHAYIWAPPRQFVVDTPSARTIDLGCQYTLRVARDGTGLLNVEMGWVAFQWKNLESFIPAGAACKTWPGRGPGTPHFTDVSAEFEAALTRFDQDRDSRSLETVLANARPRDGLTLWHLLSRTQGAERGEVFARLSKLVALPSSITAEKILNSDPAAFDAAWNALGLGDTDWWREWKRHW